MSNTKTRIEELEDRIDRLEQLVVGVDYADDPSPAFSQIEIDSSTEVITSDEGQTDIRREVLSTIREFERAYGDSAPIDYVVEAMRDEGYGADAIHDAIGHLRRCGSIYEPKAGFVKVV